MEETSLNVFSFEDQSGSDNDEPPDPTPLPAGLWRVAVIANLKISQQSELTPEAPADAGAEFDKPETIQAICNAIESDHHRAIFLNADATLPAKLSKFIPNICFNIAEGFGGDCREAQVPALLELLSIPYTASRVMANAIGLDKTMTKKVWRDSGLPIADFQEFVTGDEPMNPRLQFPLFVKPAREGTGMGMGTRSIVNTEAELRQQVNWIIESYKQPALVEEYLSGREFTVAVLGREDALTFTRHPEWYQPDGFARLPIEEVDHSTSITPGVYGIETKSMPIGGEGVPSFLCPAPIDAETTRQLQDLAIAAHKAIGTLDISRVDIRFAADGTPRLIEINTLPGLTPDFSDICVMANAAGIGYQDLILEILYLGASRFGMLTSEWQINQSSVEFPVVEQVRVRPPLEKK